MQAVGLTFCYCTKPNALHCEEHHVAAAAANTIFSYETDADGVPNGSPRQTAFKTDDPPGVTL